MGHRLDQQWWVLCGGRHIWAGDNVRTGEGAYPCLANTYTTRPSTPPHHCAVRLRLLNSLAVADYAFLVQTHGLDNGHVPTVCDTLVVQVARATLNPSNTSAEVVPDQYLLWGVTPTYRLAAVLHTENVCKPQSSKAPSSPEDISWLTPPTLMNRLLGYRPFPDHDFTNLAWRARVKSGHLG